MSFLEPRDIVAFPGGDNSSDTVFGDVHLNKTTLDHWNYTLYSNGTLSNGTVWCALAFAPYQPAAVLDNGTFVNVTWCWAPVKHIEARAGIGVGFAVIFGVALVCNVLSLAKHGKLYLPGEKRFYPIGRRWQWYWGSFTCACAMIALITGVDVDRYYMPELPLVLTSFFWYLMQVGTIALVWEAVRHWGSWMERQFIDPDPFLLRQDDRRSKVEFYLPLLAYLWMWLAFFLIIPRNWENIQFQRFPEQTESVARPSATDGRFKAAPFCQLVAWLLSVYSLWHSIKHYRARDRSIAHRAIHFFSYAPWRFLLILPLALAVIVFQELVAWNFDWSPMKVKGSNVAIYVGGYVPSLLIVVIQSVFGYFNPNEDKELLRQRRVRERNLNQEMGIVNKPGWWNRLNREGLPGESMRDIIARNVREVGGRKPTTQNPEQAVLDRNPDVEAAPANSVEMGPIPEQSLPSPVSAGNLSGARSDARREERTMEPVSGVLFPGQNEGPDAAARRHAELMMDGPIPAQPPPPYEERGRQVLPLGDARSTSEQRSVSVNTETTLTNQPQQQVRSMLDI
ncbi:hypothetical protein QBC37DRAFT_294857 [Rhypophila decipiens]|uniref:Uncharacterized protein n=1 Tax=Rhypophila decipiens TaxID=261697 RepID=A0AAN7B1I7_9PEZI|nr:hypothetical protein QBC37DRAFT_294857 [Rhypophila decipiens]